MPDKKITNWFGSRFVKSFARNIINNWEIAIVELVANCYDAGAKNVYITIGNDEVKNLIISDDGNGMTKEEFIFRWSGIGYDREKHQGNEVIFPDGSPANRVAYGRNGKGRFAMYCFSNSYIVETCKNGLYNKFKVEQRDQPFDIEHLVEDKEVGEMKTGMRISTNLKKILSLNEKMVINLIGSKFFSDPSFTKYVNGNVITEEDIGHLIIDENILTKFGDIKIKIIKTKRGRTAQQNGIQWWVNNRTVGNLTWTIADGEKLDRRYRQAREYVFIIIANFLKEDVKDDWTGFEESKRYKAIHKKISDYLLKKLDSLFQKKKIERKTNILRAEVHELHNLDVNSRDFIGTFMDQVLINCPHLNDSDLENLLKILINLEKSNIKYDLLNNLAKLETAELEDLNEILSNWSIRDAKIILTEIYRRIDFIENLEILTERLSDELHRLQPIFEKSLWIFGPEYDTIQYTSNKTLITVIKKFFNRKYTNKMLDRPDFVVKPNDFSLGIYSTDKYSLKGEPEGVGKILILELKKGDSTLNKDNMHQAEDYCLYLDEEGHLERRDGIICYVLGTKIGKYVASKYLSERNIIIEAKTYMNVINMAKVRLFKLKEKIEENKKIKDADDVISDILKQKIIN